MNSTWRSMGLALAACGACQAPPAPMRVESESAPVIEPSRPATPAPGHLRVRLSAQEGCQALQVGGVSSGPLSFRREGDRVRSSTGELAPGFDLRPAPGAPGLVIGERSYPGRLRVEADGRRGLRVENHVDLEDYVAGVVPAELILWSAEGAEIEAQAIAARTYALRSVATRHVFAERAFLWDDTRDQVYVGSFRMDDSAGARKVLARLERGLARSRGRVLVNGDGELYDVRFHASCGGSTTSPGEAFPLESRQLHAPVECAPCRAIGREERAWPRDDPRRRRVHWRWTASAQELERLARALSLGPRILSLRAPEVDPHGRWRSVELEGERGRLRISLERLRAGLGAADLKSGVVLETWPALGAPLTGGLHFEGLGRGHGAGLCQVGSHEYALRGWTAPTILGHYLPGAFLVDLPPAPAAVEGRG